MGDLVPLADYVGDPDSGTPWFRAAPDTDGWAPCAGCLIRGACREVRECQDVPPPELHLRPVPPPDIVA